MLTWLNVYNVKEIIFRKEILAVLKVRSGTAQASPGNLLEMQVFLFPYSTLLNEIEGTTYVFNKPSG